jgi:hypothetical protein
MAQLNDPKINARWSARRIRTTRPAAAWGKIDKMITKQAAVIPWLWMNVPNVVSDRIVPGKLLAVGGLLDLSATSIK